MADLAFDRTQGIMYGLTYLGNKLVQVDLTTGENYELGVISDASGIRSRCRISQPTRKA